MTPPHVCGIRLHPRIYNTSVRHKLRKRLLEKQNSRCYWCQRKLSVWWTKNPVQRFGRIRKSNAEIDHLIPRCAGGSNDETNLVAACQKCNRDRGAMYMKSAPLINIIGQEPTTSVLARYKTIYSSNHATRKKYASRTNSPGYTSNSAEKSTLLDMSGEG